MVTKLPVELISGLTELLPGAAYDINNATYNGNTFDGGATGFSGGFYISPNGQYLFGQQGNAPSYTVRRWTMSTPFDLTTAVLNVSGSYPAGMQGFAFTPTGASIIALDVANDRFYRSANIGGNFNPGSGGFLDQTLSVAGQTTSPAWANFNLDNGKMYMVSSLTNRIYQYDISNPEDLSTASFIASADLSTFPLVGGGAVNRAEVSHDGQYLFVEYSNNDDVIQKLQFNTPFEVSGGFTDTGDSVDIGTLLSLTTNVMQDFIFLNDGEYLYVNSAVSSETWRISLFGDSLVFTAADKAKLDGIEAGAEVNLTWSKEQFTDPADFTAGSSTQITLAQTPADLSSLFIAFNGLDQHDTEWSLTGTTVTFNNTIPVGVTEIEAKYLI